METNIKKEIICYNDVFSFRSDYEGWKLCLLLSFIFFLNKKGFRSDYEGWKPSSWYFMSVSLTGFRSDYEGWKHCRIRVYVCDKLIFPF